RCGALARAFDLRVPGEPGLGLRGVLVEAAAPTAIGPARLAGECPAPAEMQRCPTDRDHLGRGRGVLGGQPRVTRGDEERHARLDEVRVERLLTAELIP